MYGGGRGKPSLLTCTSRHSGKNSPLFSFTCASWTVILSCQGPQVDLSEFRTLAINHELSTTSSKALPKLKLNQKQLFSVIPRPTSIVTKQQQCTRYLPYFIPDWTACPGCLWHHWHREVCLYGIQGHSLPFPSPFPTSTPSPFPPPPLSPHSTFPLPPPTSLFGPQVNQALNMTVSSHI